MVPSSLQDMEICSNELKTIMNNVLSKREHAAEVAVTAQVHALTPNGFFLSSAFYR